MSLHSGESGWLLHSLLHSCRQSLLVKLKGRPDGRVAQRRPSIPSCHAAHPPNVSVHQAAKSRPRLALWQQSGEQQATAYLTLLSSLLRCALRTVLAAPWTVPMGRLAKVSTMRPLMSVSTAARGKLKAAAAFGDNVFQTEGDFLLCGSSGQQGGWGSKARRGKELLACWGCSAACTARAGSRRVPYCQVYEG